MKNCGTAVSFGMLFLWDFYSRIFLIKSNFFIKMTYCSVMMVNEQPNYNNRYQGESYGQSTGTHPRYLD